MTTQINRRSWKAIAEALMCHMTEDALTQCRDNAIARMHDLDSGRDIPNDEYDRANCLNTAQAINEYLYEIWKD